MEFRILGPLELREDGRPVTLTGAKPRALLAHLLLRNGQVVPADRLIDELWPNDPPLIEGGELARARALLDESRDLAERLGHRQGLACVLDFEAALAAAAGDPVEAARLLQAGGEAWAQLGAVRPADVARLVPPSPPRQ